MQQNKSTFLAEVRTNRDHSVFYNNLVSSYIHGTTLLSGSSTGRNERGLIIQTSCME